MNPRELALKRIRAQLVKVESECTYSSRGETGRLIEQRLDQISCLIEEIFDIQKHDIDIHAYMALMSQEREAG